MATDRLKLHDTLRFPFDSRPTSCRTRVTVDEVACKRASSRIAHTFARSRHFKIARARNTAARRRSFHG